MQRDELVSRFINTSQTLQRAWKAQFYRITSEERLSPAQAGILFMLKHEQPMSGSDIASKLRISRSAVTQMIDALEQQHYVLREGIQEDRRVLRLRLSEQGDKKVRQLEVKRRELLESMAGSLSDKELMVLADVHSKMLQTLEK